MSDFLPRLRDDLRITPLKEGNDENYVIEDPLRNLFFKIGSREYRFLCRLSRINSQADLVDSEGEEVSETGVSEGEALSILQWLAAKQLLQNQKEETMQALEEAEQKVQKKGLLSRLNVITFKVSLFNPDPFLDRFSTYISWLAGPLFFTFWFILGFISFAVLLANWARFLVDSGGFFSPTNVTIVGVIWVLLKFLHELSHAVACKRYGGGVYDFGILFILFIPLTYVNASSSWSFTTRWQRIHVAVAGIYMELFVAWIAAIYWATHMGTAGGMIAHNTLLVAGVSSFLFNANPLMRFDGYFVLSDLSGIPNLYFRGLDSVRRSSKRWWLGIRSTEESEYSVFVRIYGVLVYCWRFLVLFSLGFIASRMFSGWGLLLSIGAAIGWVYQPIANLFRKLSEYRKENPACVSHLFIRMFLVGCLGTFILFGVSWQRTISIPAVVLFEEEHIIRAEASGFVKYIFIAPGDQVQGGDKLIHLSNEELEANRIIIALELEKIDLQKRVAHAQERFGELQILEERKAVFTAQKKNIDADKKALTLYSPGVGEVVGKSLKSRMNTLVKKGEELFLVVNPEHKHLVASVNQNDIASLQGRIGEEVLVDMLGTELPMFTGKIEKITPRASRDIVHFSLAAPNGGPFDVRVGKEGAYQLFSPRFSVYISVPENLRHALRAGQQAIIRLKGTSASPAAILWRNGKSWFLGRQGLDDSDI